MGDGLPESPTRAAHKARLGLDGAGQRMPVAQPVWHLLLDRSDSSSCRWWSLISVSARTSGMCLTVRLNPECVARLFRACSSSFSSSTSFSFSSSPLSWMLVSSLSGCPRVHQVDGQGQLQLLCPLVSGHTKRNFREERLHIRLTE